MGSLCDLHNPSQILVNSLFKTSKYFKHKITTKGNHLSPAVRKSIPSDLNGLLGRCSLNHGVGWVSWVGVHKLFVVPINSNVVVPKMLDLVELPSFYSNILYLLHLLPVQHKLVTIMAKLLLDLLVF